MANIGIITVASLDGSPLPSNLEFGLTTNPYELPSSAQLSPTFSQLANGIYYIFYRKIGKNWSINNVLSESVDCSIISSTTNIVGLKRILYTIISANSIRILENVVESSLMIFVEGRKLTVGTHYSFDVLTKDNLFEEGLVDIINTNVEVIAESTSASDKHFQTVSYTIDGNSISLSETVTVGTIMIYVEGRKLAEGVHYLYNVLTNSIQLFEGIDITEEFLEIIAEVIN